MALALRERLPVWVQLRCGIDPKTLVAVVIVFLVAVGFGVHHFWTGRPQAVRAPEAETASAPAALRRGGAGPGEGKSVGEGPRAPTGVAGGERVVIDVSGKVRKPGIYRLPSGSRVADALKAAGGPRPGTDVSGLNRARRLVDGEQIVAGSAPVPGGTAGTGGGAGAGTGTGTASAAGAARTSGGNGSDGGNAGAGASPSTPVSLSSATAEQLQTLPGVGPVLAQHIVQYREQHGGFTSVGQLRDVNGIGARRFADLKPMVGP
jgi:competence protein ComEA